MGTIPWNVYSPTRRKPNWKLFGNIDWQTVEKKVKGLQMRIAKSFCRGDRVVLRPELPYKCLSCMIGNYPVQF